MASLAGLTRANGLSQCRQQPIDGQLLRLGQANQEVPCPRIVKHGALTSVLVKEVGTHRQLELADDLARIKPRIHQVIDGMETNLKMFCLSAGRRDLDQTFANTPEVQSIRRRQLLKKSGDGLFLIPELFHFGIRSPANFPDRLPIDK